MSNNIIDIVDEVVASMREGGNILSFSDNGDGTYTVTVDDIESLEDNDVFTVVSGAFAGDYIIFGVAGDTLKINFPSGTATETSTWLAKAPYYLYGDALEIISVLAEKKNEQKGKYEKYPLIILVLDIKRRHGESSSYPYSTEMNVVICDYTEREYHAVDRKDNVFDPILEPLYELFIEKLLAHNLILSKQKEIAHDRFDRYRWGTKEAFGSGKSILNDYLDAIEITGLTVKVAPETNINCT